MDIINCVLTLFYHMKIFKSIYGITPLKYINNLKMERAMELLDSRVYSITEAAFMSGYTDLCKFSKDFKNKTGLSPSKYVELKCSN